MSLLRYCSCRLKSKPKKKILDWFHTAEWIINDFSDALDLDQIFGTIKMIRNGLPAGYTHGFSFGDHEFYFVTAFHEDRADMGVVVRFSAQALDYYCRETNRRPYEVIRQASSLSYTIRLSRIDLTVDYINEDIRVTNIYRDLLAERVAVCREVLNKDHTDTFLRKLDLKIQGFIRGKEVPTIYLGASQSNSRLRIYDKRLEQIERSGNKLEKAMNCDTWVRFEAVFRGEYAYQLCDQMMFIKTDDEYRKLITSTMLQMYSFKRVRSGVIKNDSKVTALLRMENKDINHVLRSSATKNYDLSRSIRYLLDGSGIISTLFKIKTIWGELALKEMEALVKNELDTYDPNEDCASWLNTHLNEHRLEYSDFKSFLNTNTRYILGDNKDVSDNQRSDDIKGW
ncbi:MAG: replication initiation factor domain-containing protein [Eubacterium sp.]|nr:replication initiation factor domain-containing protein [Eubacterium sp.]